MRLTLVDASNIVTMYTKIVDKIQSGICNINGSGLVSRFQPFSHRCNLVFLCLIYKYFNWWALLFINITFLIHHPFNRIWECQISHIISLMRFVDVTVNFILIVRAFLSNMIPQNFQLHSFWMRFFYCPYYLKWHFHSFFLFQLPLCALVRLLIHWSGGND